MSLCNQKFPSTSPFSVVKSICWITSCAISTRSRSMQQFIIENNKFVSISQFPHSQTKQFLKGLRASSFEFWLIDQKYQQRLCSLATMTAKIQLFVISIFHQQKSCSDLKAKRFSASDEFQFDYSKVKTHILSFVFLLTSLLYSRKTTTTTSTSVSASGQNRES